jgi:hypothetical protein
MVHYHFIRDLFGWDEYPQSVTDFWEVLLPSKLNSHKIWVFFSLQESLVFFCVCGTEALGLCGNWKIRNKMAIEKKLSM